MTERTLVTFRVGEQLCGLDAARVQDVFQPRGIARVPLARAEIAGVMNLRGRLVTLLCARTRLGLPPRTDEQEPIAIGVQLGGDSYGLLVDSVCEVQAVPASDFRGPPGALPPAWAESLDSICQLEDELLVVLDGERLLSRPVPTGRED